MNFKSLLKQHSWLSIEANLLDLYPDEEKNSLGYREVYKKLVLMPPADSQISIVVKNCKDDLDGKYLNPNYSLELVQMNNRIRKFYHFYAFTKHQNGDFLARG